MVRTKQTARKSTGGVVNRKLLSKLAKRVGQPFITEKRGPITLGTYDGATKGNNYHQVIGNPGHLEPRCGQTINV
jgi:hypothetical protein